MAHVGCGRVTKGSSAPVPAAFKWRRRRYDTALPVLLLLVVQLLLLLTAGTGAAAVAVDDDGREAEEEKTVAPVSSIFELDLSIDRPIPAMHPAALAHDTHAHPSTQSTQTQIIGIFSQPSHAPQPPCDGHCEYIAASYVKWVEAAGGRAVPIPYNATIPVLDALFERINGLLLPGGGNPLPEAAVYMIERALVANDAGDYFPVRACVK